MPRASTRLRPRGLQAAEHHRTLHQPTQTVARPGHSMRQARHRLPGQLAHDYKAMDSADSRSVGLAYALRVLAQSYAEHPAYRREWRP
ncbi:DUF6221 family protein [Streptomyces sp. NBC_01351]|uniref:DUF6221 family protein n=1 Tax=Streptomyces sp. NBC_01351 TaxID=2903833 RepID=UPI003FCCE88A